MQVHQPHKPLFSGILIILLLFMQHASAVHSIVHHSIEDPLLADGESCSVCHLYQKFGQSAPVITGVGFDLPAQPILTPAGISATLCFDLADNHSRAPPYISLN